MKAAAVIARDALGVAGAAIALVGVDAIYRPAALILLGLCLFGAAWLLARRS